MTETGVLDGAANAVDVVVSALTGDEWVLLPGDGWFSAMNLVEQRYEGERDKVSQTSRGRASLCSSRRSSFRSRRPWPCLTLTFVSSHTTKAD